MKIRYWGTRGSIPSPSAEGFGFYTQRYGGNTSCVEVLTPGEEIIIDAGSGIRMLGLDVMKRKKDGPWASYLLLSHSHWDHIQGFPFFVPGYLPDNSIKIYGQEKDFFIMRRARPTTKQVLEHQQVHPYFPVPLEMMKGGMEFNDMNGKETLDIGSTRIRTAELNHPDGYIGFRLEHDGKVFVYASDNETDGGRLGENLLELSENADLLLHDAQYTPEEYQMKKSWGHSTYEHAIDNALRANAKKLVLFHHDPVHDDEYLDSLFDRANKYAERAMDAMKREIKISIAREGGEEIL
ncbi:MAG: MBL fold metallo-hydrolase [Candidatus Aenigmarchaeota archaeon]|nr:MBL fold metallo-hydrolase [Candidatus Aenigmarchaeota archaeon]